MGAYIDRAKIVDWITPPEDVSDIIVPVLGGQPDVEPCSNVHSFVKARVVWGGTGGPETDAFLHEWHKYGKTCFLNPTFGELPPKEQVVAHFHPLSAWMQKVWIESQRGLTVLCLLPAATSARWFHDVIPNATSFCLLRKRRQFYSWDEETQQLIRHKQPGQAHLYALFTQDNEVRSAFDRILDPHGMVIEPGGLGEEAA